MFEIEDWDGLAKIGKYHVGTNVITTPALFPVVDPAQQITPISEMKKRYGFDQVITSAYLMSKRVGHTNWNDYPKVKDYLEYDGVVMMDSGAYQVMVYGDIELSVIDTINLQAKAQPDIGVLMDHPIGYDIGYEEAKTRVQDTISNIEESISHLPSDIKWTLPIQGGKYLDLLETYLEEMTRKEIIDNFDFYALGSVVPIMINQDYLTLVEMIALTREYLPEDRPLHLFGAGHPAMFALATFLGCDTFDSAAYVLMAKDNRYMTIDGTYQLENLEDFPCFCDVCMNETPKSMLSKSNIERRELLAQHNLNVSSGEIRTVRQNIRDGTLWDLVLKRANAAPNLALATRRAIELVTQGRLQRKFEAGIPVSKSSMQRVTRLLDLEKPLLRRHRAKGFEVIESSHAEEIICLAFPVYRSIYNRLPDRQLSNYDTARYQPVLLLPPVGLVPLGASELYPLGQMINEVRVNDLPQDFIQNQIGSLLEIGKKITIYYADELMTDYLGNLIRPFDNITLIHASSVLTEFNQHVQDQD